MKTMKKKEKLLNYYVLPLMAILFLVPLIIRYYLYNNRLSQYQWMSGDGTSVDLFLHGKMVVFQFLCIVIIIAILIYIYQSYRNIRIPKSFLFLAGYGILTLLSSFVSDYNTFSFSGIYEQFESVWCLLGYVLVVFYAYLVIHENHAVDLLLYTVVAASLVIGLIGASQAFGHDLLMTSLAKLLYMPRGASAEFSLVYGTGTTYMTLYNPDYVAFYSGLILPLLFAIYMSDRSKYLKIITFIDMILLVISAIASTAAVGSIVLVIDAVLLLIAYGWQLRHNRGSVIRILGVLFVLIIIAVGTKYMSEQMIASHKETVISNERTESTSDQVPDTAATNPTATKLTSIKETDDYVEYNYDNHIFRQTMSVDGMTVYLHFTDQNNNEISYEYDPIAMVYTLTEPGLEGIVSQSAQIGEKYIGFVTTIDQKQWIFTYTYNDENILSYYYYNGYGKLTKTIDAPSAIFTNHDSLFNGRGYIWGKTIALLKNTIFLGTGADSFTLVFPQEDYVHAYRAGYENMIVSKPHCMYLQVAVQTGVISLLCLLAFYLWYMTKTIKLCWLTRIYSVNAQLSISILIGTIAFLAVGLVNDSTICITPVFAVLLGLGIALNHMSES